MEQILEDLQKRGCWPAISWRGNCWRAHVNAAGNYWEEASTPKEALVAAKKLWEHAGCPKDGYADSATVS